MEFLRKILLSLSLLCFIVLTQALQPSIILTEKNVLRNEGEFLIINHNDFIESSERSNIKVKATISKEYYNPDRYPMVFGRGAVLKDDFFMNTKNPKIIEGTKVSIKNRNIEYEWNAEIEPNKVAVIAYENYYGEMSSLYEVDGIKLGNLKIFERWDVNKGEKIDIQYRFKNLGESSINNLSFLLFLPEKEINQEQLIMFFDIGLSDNLVMIEDFYSRDSLGRFMKGISIERKRATILEPNEEIKFEISLNSKPLKEGEIAPTLAIVYNQYADNLGFGFKSSIKPKANEVRFVEGSSIIFPTPYLELANEIKIKRAYET
jgi:hypothetical protein